MFPGKQARGLELDAASKIYAVLTGDLVGSTKSDKTHVDHTMHVVSAGLPDGVRWGWAPRIDLRFTRSQNDRWQMLLESPKDSLRWAVVILAALKADPDALASRIAIGIGTVETLGSGDLSDASGPAFTASGRALDAMYKDERLFITGAETDSSGSDRQIRVSGAEKAVVLLIEERISRWTPEQAEATAHFLHPDNPSATEVARRLTITPQAVGYRLKGAGAKPLREALQAIEGDWTKQWGNHR